MVAFLNSSLLGQAYGGTELKPGKESRNVTAAYQVSLICHGIVLLARTKNLHQAVRRLDSVSQTAIPV